MVNEPPASPRPAPSFWRDNGLSIALIVLYVITLGLQCVTGYFSINSDRTSHGLPALAVGPYLETGTFLDGMCVNLQAAFLQLAVLVTFSALFIQRGAAHSRKPDDESAPTRGKAPILPAGRPKTSPRRRTTWLYRHSLSLAFFGLFFAFFVLHAWLGSKGANEVARLTNGPHIGVGGYSTSAQFWFSNFQTWQAEFLAISAYVIFSIFLRQEGSSESKPEDAGDDETGVVNE
jgi:hypothetical protein